MPFVPVVFFVAFHDTKAVEILFGGWRFILVIVAFVALGVYLSRRLLEIEESKRDRD
jgi:hypothetical protein